MSASEDSSNKEENPQSPISPVSPQFTGQRSGEESEELRQLKDQLDKLFNSWKETNDKQLTELNKISDQSDNLDEKEKDELQRYKLKIVERCNEKSWVTEALNDRIKWASDLENQGETDASRSPRTTTTKDDLGEGSMKKRRYIWR
ncbi:hypothetical protein TRICI_001316 [Trichomonascus ciferrii]|uniref:Uncharacterized protein n=1 Tax=Trichomonascus ciferrii TaxID=44093 RepID=A0A642V9J8_9ASCO|nr:hypothetical protein TRICI_001316 [Trichomonascus ciferrii]